jgi:predicted lipoprotein with Yx(FWY)xxD motif
MSTASTIDEARNVVGPSADLVAVRTRRDHLDPTTRSDGTMRFKIAHAALIALIVTGAYLGIALLLSSPASAQSSSCDGPVTSAPTGRATVTAAWTPDYGRVLIVGSGPYAGCSLYLLTSDQLHALTGAPYACSDNANVREKPCDTVLWPALLTNGAPIAGPGVNPRLLGTVTRTDLGLPGVLSVEQVTYAGWPLYRFFRDQAPGDMQGANLNDPVTTPAGIWYLLNPRGGIPATGQAELELKTAPLDGTGPQETVLAARMNNDYSQFPNTTFPAYTLSRGSGSWWSDPRSQDRGRKSGCQGTCAVFWPPVLTSGWPEAGPGVNQHAIGVIMSPDGSRQVTYDGQPLYLFNDDAYIGGTSPVGTQGIYGAGAVTPSGVFNTIPPLP